MEKDDSVAYQLIRTSRDRPGAILPDCLIVFDYCGCAVVHLHSVGVVRRRWKIAISLEK